MPDERRGNSFVICFCKQGIRAAANGSFLHPLDEETAATAYYLGKDDTRFVYARFEERDCSSAIPLMLFLSRLKKNDRHLISYGHSLVSWHKHNAFCSKCGEQTTAFLQGSKRRCTVCENESYPRVDPCVMILLTRNDQALLARQSRFPKNMYSALAGFVSHGESAEECVLRETFEETGLEVEQCKYVASEPWAFPHSLMLAFHAHAKSGEPKIDHRELEAAKWFTKEQIRKREVLVPPPASLANRLILDWVENGS